MTVKSIKLYKSEEYKNSKGKIQKYVSIKNSFFSGFGEVYFNSINKNSHKGWNLHKKATCFLSVASGSVKFQIKDEKFKLIKNVIINKKNHKCIQIPPGIWFSFKAMGQDSVVINSINLKHQSKETRKMPI